MADTQATTLGNYGRLQPEGSAAPADEQPVNWWAVATVIMGIVAAGLLAGVIVLAVDDGGSGGGNKTKCTALVSITPNIDNTTTAQTIPPDPHVAVGMSRIVAVDNGFVDIRRKSDNARIGFVPLNSIFTNITLAGYGDPWISYDSTSDRFFLTAFALSSVGVAPPAINFGSRLGVAVSTSSDPNDEADWHVYYIDSSETDDQLFDYPKHATDSHALYLSWSRPGPIFFNNSAIFQGAGLLALDKQALMDGVGLVWLWFEEVAGRRVMMPALRRPNVGADKPLIFVDVPFDFPLFINPGYVFPPVDNYEIYTATAAGLSATPILVPSPDTLFLEEINARQPFSPSFDINSFNGPILSAVVSGNDLYVAHTQTPGNTQIAVRWARFDVGHAAGGNAQLTRWGNLNFGPDVDTFWPAINVNGDGDIAIVYLYSGPAIPQSLGYTVVYNKDAGSTGLQIAAAGEFPYYQTFGGQTNRAGDYSGLDVDPANEQVFYGFGHSPDSNGPLGNITNACNPADPSGAECIALDWTETLFTFRVASGKCCEVVPVSQPDIAAFSIASAGSIGTPVANDQYEAGRLVGLETIAEEYDIDVSFAIA